MIKSIYFDLDGVLVDSKEIHYSALNMALETIDKKYMISKDEHLKIYNGLPTMKKLELLTKQHGLKPELYNHVWKMKQFLTLELVKEYTPDERLIKVLEELKNQNFTIYVASNCIYSTLLTILSKKGFLPFVDYFISNEDVKNPKPSSEIYFKCLIRNEVNPHEVLILEDSPIGIEAAKNSGCHVMEIQDSKSVTFEAIMNRIKLVESKKYKNDKLNIVIPCAGAGSRFQKVGYTFPKPLIDVNGKPMIQVVVENLNIDAHYIYIVQKSHYEKYNLHHFLNLLTPNLTIIQIEGITEGAAISVLKAKEYINNENPLLIVNSDQYLEWNSKKFMETMEYDNEIDAGISTFINTHPKWSFVKLNEQGFVSEVAEKKPISNIATTGIYYWKQGHDFVKYANQMISKDIRVNNEYYVCPVFNEAIQDNKKIKIDYCERMWGLGTPEDLQTFLISQSTITNTITTNKSS